MKRWLPFVLWLIFCGAIIVCADGGLARWVFDAVNGQPFADKIAHMFLIGMLAFLLNHALAGRKMAIGRSRFQLGGIVIAAIMTLEEFSQIWIPTRSFDWGDLASNYVGIVCAELIARVRFPLTDLGHKN